MVHALHELREVRTNMAPHEVVVWVMTGKSRLTVTKYRDKLDRAAIPFPGSPDLRNQCEPENYRQTHSRLCSRYPRNSIERDQTALEVGRGRKPSLSCTRCVNKGRPGRVPLGGYSDRSCCSKRLDALCDRQKTPQNVERDSFQIPSLLRTGGE